MSQKEISKKWSQVFTGHYKRTSEVMSIEDGTIPWLGEYHDEEGLVTTIPTQTKQQQKQKQQQKSFVLYLTNPSSKRIERQRDTEAELYRQR